MLVNQFCRGLILFQPKMARLLALFSSTIVAAIKQHQRQFILTACLFSVAAPLLHAQEQDLDNFKWRLTGLWWYFTPTGYFDANGNMFSFDLQKDFQFGYYSTLTTNVDWKFKRKQHVLFGFTPIVDTSNARTITRTINFQGVTYTVGTAVTADLRTLSFSPGYQYDFIRRKHGYLGGAVQMYLLDTKSSLSGSVFVNNQSAIQTASAHRLAPVPVIGPHGRWYPLHDSDRLDLEGFIQGMYFFGNGDMVTSRTMVGVAIVPHWRFTAGYQWGTVLSLHGKSNQIGFRLVEKGAAAGIEASW